ncbi:MAG: hypothetical protein WEF50_18280 [Myxococcota bacterium]
MIDIVEEHFEELDFLWELREGVIFAPDWNLDELAELEERAEAHLDGLRLAELHAVDVARPQLAGEHTSGATAATFVLMETGDPELMAEVVTALEGADAPARDGIRLGLRHSRIDAIESRLYELAASAAPPVRAAAADVLAFHRLAAPPLDALLVDDLEQTRALAWGAHGRLARARQRAPLVAALADESPAVRRAALEAAARCALANLSEICRVAAREDANSSAVEFLGVLGDRGDADYLRSLLSNDALSRASVRALGALGDPATLPTLLEAAGRKELLAPAIRAVARITGVARLFEVADEDDPEQARTLLETVTRREARRLDGQRCQSGRPLVPGASPSSLDALSLESRRDVYLGLRAGSSGILDVELEQRIRRSGATRAAPLLGNERGHG